MDTLLRPACLGSMFVLVVFLAVCWVFDGLPFSAPHTLPPLGGLPPAELASAAR